MNYTKGEWKVAPAIDIPYKTSVMVGRLTVADIVEMPVLGEAEANTNLIAAAPDMYEALKRVVKYFDRIIADTSEKYESAMVLQAKAAILKAEGKQ